jgi:hypothetical protein
MKGYKEIPAPVVRGIEALGYTYVYNKAFTKNGCNVWVTRDLYPNGEVRWHLSISRTDRYPVWDEIRDARYALLPDDCTMAMLLPPKAQYVNLHPRCFHLHEIMDNQA